MLLKSWIATIRSEIKTWSDLRNELELANFRLQECRAQCRVLSNKLAKSEMAARVHADEFAAYRKSVASAAALSADQTKVLVVRYRNALKRVRELCLEAGYEGGVLECVERALGEGHR